MDGFLNQGHELIMDNWYSSPVLMKELHERKTYAYGTLRSNRKHVPKDIKLKEPGQPLKKGVSVRHVPTSTYCMLDGQKLYSLLFKQA